MACIKSASRSALAAFSPDSPFLAAGTLAGAIDLSFSSSANVEIFKLDFRSDSQELLVAGSRPSSDRFHSLSWGRMESASEEYRMGLIAGGLADGNINVWNPLRIIDVPCSADAGNIDDGLVVRLAKHTGPVHGLEFNVLSPKLLASGGDEGELCIWDLENPLQPNRYPSLKNPGPSAQSGISSVSWNPKFRHIVASTSYNGMTVVWDLQHQKPITSISDKRRCSVLQWNPDISTQLLVASDDDDSPSLKLWDLRKTISPIKEFVGHSKGVIAMSWCPSDSSLLLTCAKDNRTICWDTIKGEVFSELPASTNWNFDIQWYTRIPGVISASSYDGKIGIYNIEDMRTILPCHNVKYSNVETPKTFFRLKKVTVFFVDACSKQVSINGDFGSSANLRAPKWFKCPVSISFGFGGKLVSCQPSLSASGVTCGSEVYVHNVVTEDSLVKRSTEFETSVNFTEKSELRLLCERKSESSESEDDKEVWAFLKIMFEEEGTARTKLLGHLGFTVPDTNDGNLSELTSNLRLDEGTVKTSGFLGVEGSAYQIDSGDDFFNNVQPSSESLVVSEDNVSDEKEVLHEPQEHVENIDETIMHSLIVGDYKGAVQLCMSANRMADALVIANASGPASGSPLWENTRDQYLNKSHLPYLKVVSALVNNDLMSLVKTRPLSSWKETMALLCTYGQKEEWTSLCDSLASKLIVGGDTLAATLCYICAGNIDKTVEIWSQKLISQNGGKTYVDLLQDLMEKIIILTLATGQKQFSASLSKLVENYAELLVSQGLLTTAMGYLKLLGSEDSTSEELAILRNRILLSIEERETSHNVPSEGTVPQAETLHSSQQSSYGHTTESVQYYTDTPQLQQRGLSGSQYPDMYSQPAGSYGYQPVQQERQFQGNAVPFQPAASPQFQGNPVPFQPAATPQMFLPTQSPPMQQPSAAPPVTVTQPTMRPFIPATPAALRNVEQYQPPSLGSQLYPPSVTPAYQPAQHGHGVGLSHSATVPNVNFAQPLAPTSAPGGFAPATNAGFVHSSGLGPVQPSSPTQTTVTQPVNPPAAPPATVQTVDTSSVPAEFRPVVTTLTRLYNETSEALGGSRANPAKKREIEDNSRKIGSLFAKLNNQDISPNAASKLVQLCQALDSGDFAAALHIQVILTTSEWDECNFWLAALKRMIKTRQNMRS